MKIYEKGYRGADTCRAEVQSTDEVLKFIRKENDEIGGRMYRIYGDNGNVYFDLGCVTYFVAGNVYDYFPKDVD